MVDEQPFPNLIRKGLPTARVLMQSQRDGGPSSYLGGLGGLSRAPRKGYPPL